MSLWPTSPKLTAAIADLLSDGRPRDVGEIAAALRSRGLDLGDDAEDLVDDALLSDSVDLHLVCPLADSRLARCDVLLAGRTFTHRLSEAELALDYLVVIPDFAAPSTLPEVPAYQRLVDGSTIASAIPGLDDELLDERGIPAQLPDDEVWMLQPGTLAELGVAAGEVICLTVRPNGFELSPLREAEPAGEVAAQLAKAVEAGAGMPVELMTLLWQVCADSPEAFAEPLPPLSELVEHAGLAIKSEWIAPAGFDFDGWHLQHEVNSVRERYGLDGGEAVAVVMIRAAFDEFAEAGTGVPESPLLRDSLNYLQDPAVAAALLAETIGAEGGRSPELVAFTEAVTPMVTRRVRPALLWLQGRALERMDRVLEAEQVYESALSLGDFPSVLEELARFAGDRGDAERGLSLLRRAGVVDDDDLVVLLSQFRAPARSDLARNAACWCGSGRKYKACHLNQQDAPLSERAFWLYQKASIYLSDGPWRGDLLDLASIRVGPDAAGLELYRATQDPLVVDSLLFEGGAFERFLATRGALLPDDERMLAELWLLAERTLWEIEEVRPGSGFTARDLRTGERVDVRERSASRQIGPGELVCARLVPAGDTVQCFGGLLSVPFVMRDRLLSLLDRQPPPAELVAMLSPAAWSHQVANTEGHPMVLCRTVLRTSDPAALAELLDGAYSRDDDGLPVWRELVDVAGGAQLRATLELRDDLVTVETNSEQRQDRVLADLRERQPGLEVVEEERTKVDDLREAMRRAPRRIRRAGRAARPGGPGRGRGAGEGHPPARTGVAGRADPGAGRGDPAGGRGGPDPAPGPAPPAGQLPGRGSWPDERRAAACGAGSVSGAPNEPALPLDQSRPRH